MAADRLMVDVSAQPDGDDAVARGRWRRFDERLELVSMRPKLAADVRIRMIGDEAELVQLSTKRVVPIAADQTPIVRRFDGSTSIAEIIVAGMGDRGFALQPTLTLIDRLVRAELLDSEVPIAQWHALIDHVARLAIVGGASGVRLDADSPEVDEPSFDDGEPWKPLTAAIEDRAKFLRGVRLLEALDDRTIGKLAEVAHEETWPAAADIVSEGGRSDRFFIVRSGAVNVARRDDTSGERHRLGTLNAGDWFGDSGIRDAAPRNATVRASLTQPVRLYSFDAGIFEQLIEPHLQPRVERELAQRRREELQRVPLFRALAPVDLDLLAAALRSIEVPRGTILFRQGDLADKFYIVVRGGVGVVRDGRPIARIGAGEFFGETALLFTEERTATIAATEDSELWTLDRADFTNLVRDALLHRHDMMPTVLGRISSTDPV
jgi:CRP-like cAMP-binding protein